ncbi:MAG: elongation factor G [Bacteroidales bacterium]|nr:elongation factor G [Bacteroidales bacterium]
MKEYLTKDIRNVVLLGSTKSGKTTLAETMLYEGKVIDRRGAVEDKNTVSDYNELEKLNQRSIYATPLYAEFMDKKINFIDTPGSDDFIGGAYTAFRVCESGILVVNAQQGVEVGTENLVRRAEKIKFPLVIAVNQLDAEKADWENVMASMKEAFGSKIINVQIPVNPGPGYNCFVDLLMNKCYRFKDTNGTREEIDMPADMADVIEEARQELIEKAAEFDEGLMEKFFEVGELDEDDIRKGLNLGIVNGEVYPVFCVSAKNDVGVKRLLEFTKNVAPAPQVDENGPAALFIYKNDIEAHLGEVSYFKVMSGNINAGVDLEDAKTGNKERISALYAVAGVKKESVNVLHAGDFGCLVKLKNGKSGITLSQPGSGIAYDKIEFPAPKYRCAIKAKVQQDEQKLGDALKKIASTDPTFIVDYNKELRQTILNGNGEQHINIVKWLLNNEYKLDVELFAPKVPYRETITKVATAQYRHKKQSGGAGQFGEVHLLVCPAEGELNTKFKIDGKETVLNVKTQEQTEMDWGGKLEFYNCVVGGAIDLSFMPAILKGIKEKMVEGPLTGSYARDIRVFVYDGKMHPVDSKEIAFIIAGRNAFKEAFRNAGPKILEPIYNVEVITPAEYQGAVMSDIQNRRGMLGDMGADKGFAVLKARIPLAELYRYSTSLSSLTQGSATFTMEYADYQPVPGDVQNKLLAEYAAQETDED